MKYAPSILNAPFDQLKSTISSLKDAFMLHIDIMDGHFVPNLSFGYDIIKQVNVWKKAPLDIHFMTTHPAKWVEQFLPLLPQYMTIHVEAKDVDYSIQLMKSHHIGVGLAIKPSTPVEMIMPYIQDLDLVLVMTVEPGFGGQSFMVDMLEKVKQLHQLKSKYEFIIEVDGGVNDETRLLCEDALVDVAVVGSHLFKQEVPNDWLKKVL
jgi:ribulose-phosphate 3-epimerase